jgi:hypothetical protein
VSASPVYERVEEGPANFRAFTDRRQLIMMLMASGWRNVDIAREFSISENYVSTMRTSPLFRRQIGEIQRQWRESSVLEVMDMIEREAHTSVGVLVEIRDDAGLKQSPAGQNVRKAAADSLLDRHPRFAKRTKHEEEVVHRIVFSRADVEQMQRALGAAPRPAQDDVVDTDPLPS